jgi:phage shock protein C
MKKKLYRSLENRKLAGVCGGIAEYFDIDPVMVRLAWVIFFLAGGAGVLAYILAWIIIPEKPAG